VLFGNKKTKDFMSLTNNFLKELPSLLNPDMDYDYPRVDGWIKLSSLDTYVEGVGPCSISEVKNGYIRFSFGADMQVVLSDLQFSFKAEFSKKITIMVDGFESVIDVSNFDVKINSGKGVAISDNIASASPKILIDVEDEIITVEI
jgi:hypothetical protein